MEWFAGRSTITISFPDDGINAETGVVFFIDGFGHDPELDYSTLIRRYIASRYNCLCIGVAYFGCRLMTRFSIEPGADFFAMSNAITASH